jgi:hypothetical protein
MFDDLGVLVVMPVLSPSSEFVASAFADPGMAIAFRLQRSGARPAIVAKIKENRKSIGRIACIAT